MAKKKTTRKKAAPKVEKKTTQAFGEPGQKQVLHVGCGPYNPNKLPAAFRSDEWREVRLDIDENAKPDIVSDMLNMDAVADGSMDALYSSHNVEHLYPHQFAAAFKEFFRVLKPGGRVVITMPDIQTICAYVAEGLLEEKLYDSPAGPISPIDVLFGLRSAVARGNTFMAHKSGMSAHSLARHLLDNGFCNVSVRREWIDLWATAYKLPTDHPKYQKMARITNGKMQGSAGQKLPSWYQRRLEIEQSGVSRPDELDVSPAYYKAPALPKAG